MNKLFTSIAIVALAIIFYGVSNPGNIPRKPIIDTGAVGDVKYSVLPPEKFRSVNGPNWYLLDDQVPLVNSKLASLEFGITALPDARGMFIRGLNDNRSDAYADPFSQENNNRMRKITDIQSDDFKRHNHPINGRFMEAEGGRGFNGYGLNSNSAVGYQTYSTSENGGNETRPKNIALYVYIKIN